MRDIASVLKRSISTISDELSRNQTKGIYDTVKANQKARVRRRAAKFQWKKIVQYQVIRKYIEEKLYEDRSPESIAGRIKYVERRLPYVSKDSIYRYLKSVHGRRLESYRAKIKPKKKPRRIKGCNLTNRTFIDKRPQRINARACVGDTEADFIVSGRTGKGILLTVVCRKLRIVCIEKILPVTIENVHKAFIRIKKRFPEMRSISTDNDILLEKHKELEKLLQMKIYFCHPYHSWEKGSNENVNGHVRKYIPKGADVSFYSKEFVRKIERKLNERYLKCLRYATPYEKLELHRKRKKRRSA